MSHKVKELIEFVDTNKFYHLGDLADELYDQLKSGDLKLIEKRIDPDECRWYRTAYDIYQCEDGFVRVHGLSQVYSEGMYNEDANVICEAEEVERVEVIKYEYKVKKNG